jgi:hypothetical protein
VGSVAYPLDNSLSLNCPVFAGSVTYSQSVNPNALTSIAGPDLTAYTNIILHYGFTNATYAIGDFNYDGEVGLSDYTGVILHYGQDLHAPPTAPGQMVLNAIGSPSNTTAKVQVQWNAPTAPAGYELTGYEVQRTTDSSVFADSPIPVSLNAAGTSMMSWPDSNVVDGTRYWYRARAVYTNDATSATIKSVYTPKMAITTSLMAVASLNAFADATDINLSWPAGSASTTGYNIYYKPHDANDPTPDNATKVPLTRADLSDTANPSYKITGLNPSTQYDVWVQATNDRTDAAYTVQKVATPGIPSSPPQPTTALIAPQGVQLTWPVASGSQVVTRYTIQRSVNGSSFATLQTID